MSVLEGFEDPWEHVRLLSDVARNEVMLDMLARRAPGARVLEVGCGTGLLSCIAARLGARRVYAVEPTPRWLDAHRLVERNGLQDIVTVVNGRVQDVPVQSVDLAFSELLNADPFLEEVLEAMDAASSWLAPGGCLAPRRLSVWVALVRDGGSAREVRRARRELASWEKRFDLDLGAVEQLLARPGPYSYVSSTVELASDPVCLWDFELGSGARPDAICERALAVSEPGPVGGATVWFEAEYDDGLVMSNRPGQPGHWGHLVCAWPEEQGARRGQHVGVRVEVDDGHLEVYPVAPSA